MKKEKNIHINMSKEYSIISLSLILLFSLFACTTEIPESIEGIETIETLEERTYLRNDWKQYYGDSPDFALPEFDDSSWESIDVPRMNFPYHPEKSNFFWLRKSFFVSENVRGEPLGYACGKLPDSTQLFFNGAFIGTSGSMPPKPYFPTPTYPRTFLLPDDLVNYGGNNVIAMRVYTERDYGDIKGGFITNDADRMSVYVWQYAINVVLPMIMTYFSLIVSSYFLLMFLRNREERFNLYMFLQIIFIGIYATAFFIDLATHYIVGLKIWYISLLLAATFFVYYFQDFYNIHRNYILRIIISVIVGVCCIILFLADSVITAYFLVYKIYYNAIITPLLLYSGYLSFAAIRKGNKYAKVLLAGVCLIIGASVHDIIYISIQVEPAIWLANTGFIFYILFVFLSNASRFMDTKKEVDSLNIELTQQKDAFFRFVPTQFLSLLGKQSAIDISLGDSSQRSMSVLFSDIRKFTTISEEKSPEESFHLLNSYLLRMESPISDNEGFVDKYIGDAIMALFSETSLYDDGNNKSSADRAILAAVGMRKQLDEFNLSQSSRHMDILNMGIGINTGPLMLGTVGGTHRLDTTVIGDSVNLASRLEKLTQFYKAGIIISEWSYNNLSDPDSLLIREIDLVIVKGKSESCKIYEVFEADPEDIRELKMKTRDIIETGMQKFKEKKFKDALTYFKEAKNVYPKDIIPLHYIKRCVSYMRNPPPPNWSGIFKVHA